MFMKHYAPNRCEPSIEALNFSRGDQGRCEHKNSGGGGGVGSGGGGSGWGERGQGRSEQRSEVFLNIFSFFGVGGSGGGSGFGGGGGGSGWM